MPSKKQRKIAQFVDLEMVVEELDESYVLSTFCFNFEETMFFKCAIIFSSVAFISGCGGSSGEAPVVDLNFSALTIFSDNAGVTRGIGTDGRETLGIIPNVVADVAGSNAATENVDPIAKSDYPVIDRLNGYNIRQGTFTQLGIAANTLVAEKIGSNQASILYLSDGFSDALFVYSAPLASTPLGEFVYNGIYFAGSRSSSFAEYGTVALTGNFSNSTFSVRAQSASTSLNGTGFIDNNSGRISSNQLTFVSPLGTFYSATALGRFGNNDAEDVSGLFYTNDNNPDYAGAFAASR